MIAEDKDVQAMEDARIVSMTLNVFANLDTKEKNVKSVSKNYSYLQKEYEHVCHQKSLKYNRRIH